MIFYTCASLLETRGENDGARASLYSSAGTQGNTLIQWHETKGLGKPRSTCGKKMPQRTKTVPPMNTKMIINILSASHLCALGHVCNLVLVDVVAK